MPNESATTETTAAPVAPAAATAPDSLLSAPAPTPAPAAPAPAAEAPKPAAAVAPVAPVPLELKLPEGVTKDDPLIAGFTPLAQEFGLKGEQAQKLVDLYAGAQKAQTEKTNAALIAETKAWQDATKADPEIGGEKFAASIALANKAVSAFGGQELFDILKASGLGSHPVVVKAFARAGKAIAEDTSAGTSNGAAPSATTAEARLRALYPNSPELFERK